MANLTESEIKVWLNPFKPLYEKHAENNRKLYLELSKTENNEEESDIEVHSKKKRKIVTINLAENYPNNDIIRSIYDLFYSDLSNGIILTFHHGNDEDNGLDKNVDRIEKLFAIQEKYKNHRDEQQLKKQIKELYETNPYFVLQTKMENTFPDYTPAKGLCWLIAEYQAYYRGIIEPKSDIDSFKNYAKEDLEKILTEAYNMMIKQRKDGYSEAKKFTETALVENTHKHFINAWENKQSKDSMLNSGAYSKTVPDFLKDKSKSVIHDCVVEFAGPEPILSEEQKSAYLHGERWGGQYGFGTLFFSGYGSTNAPPLNYFIDNANLPMPKGEESIYKRKNYATLHLILPFSTDYSYLDKDKRFFSLKDIESGLTHNNNILFSQAHFQPMDWPNGLKKNCKCWNDAVSAIVNTTAGLLCDQHFDIKNVNIKSVLKMKG